MRTRLITSVLITAGAVTVGIVHLIWPNIRIDAVTFGLIVVALLPWLAPIVKSIELPGGLKVELQELKQEVKVHKEQVRTLERRVEQVEDVVFTGDAPVEQQTQVASDLSSFSSHLVNLLPKEERPHIEPPRIHLTNESPALGPAYSSLSNTMRLGVEHVGEPHFIYHEYSHHFLYSINDVARGIQSAVESGVADFLTCSFDGNPTVFEHANRRLDRFLDARALSTDSDLRAIGEVLAAGLWAVRACIGSATTDVACISAWRLFNSGTDTSEFAELFVEVVASSMRGQVMELFVLRHIIEP